MNELLDFPEKFFDALKRRFLLPLPGEPAQNKMTSRVRIPTEESLKQRPDHIRSAVLLPLFPHGGTVYTALIRRPSYPGAHSGQLALPGGKWEKEDASQKETALRETTEEVGVVVLPQQVIGPLTPLYIPVSNYLVQPFVAVLDSRPEWKPDHHEVESILEVPLGVFTDPLSKDRRRISIGKSMFVDAPCYIVKEQVLWGATAMMFSELEAILEGQ